MSLLLVAWHGHTGLAEKLSNFTYLWVPRVFGVCLTFSRYSAGIYSILSGSNYENQDFSH